MQVSEVRQVLLPHIGDIHEIQCVKDHQVRRRVPPFDLQRQLFDLLLLGPPQDREVWFQIKIPLSRNLTVGCSSGGAGVEPDQRASGGHPCPPQVPFFYLPINHQQPDQPCG